MPLATEAPAGGEAVPVESHCAGGERVWRPVDDQASTNLLAAATAVPTEAPPAAAPRLTTAPAVTQAAQAAATYGYPTLSHPGGASSFRRLRRYVRPEHSIRRANLCEPDGFSQYVGVGAA